MTVLSDSDIGRELGYGDLDVSPVDLEEQLQPNSLDIRLGTNFSQFMDRDEPLDCSRGIREYDTFDFSKKEGEVVTMDPGDFLLADAMEIFDIPDYLYGQLHGRSSIGRLGIEVHSTAGILDSGFRGSLTLELTNNSNRSVNLYSGMRIAQVVFHKLSTKCSNPYSEEENKYQGQEGVVHSRLSEEL